MLVSLLGAPGSGKGSQARYLNETYGFVHISTGELLREQIALKTAIGQEIESAMNSGGLGDHVVMEAVNLLLNESLTAYKNKTIILDGFPRLPKQCVDLETMIKVKGIEMASVIEFAVPFEVLEKRIVGRYTCSSCKAVYHRSFNKTKVEGVCDFCGSSSFDQRMDDTQEVFKRRYQSYLEQVSPIKAFYEERNQYDQVDASLGINETNQALCSILKKRGVL